MARVAIADESRAKYDIWASDAAAAVPKDWTRCGERLFVTRGVQTFLVTPIDDKAERHPPTLIL